MTDATEHDDRLDAFFAAARSAAPEPSAALLARVEAEALALRPAPAPAVRARSGGGLRRLVDLLGGWSAMGGFATAAVAGVWIGFSGPGSLGDAADGLIGYLAPATTVDLMPDLGDAGLTMEDGK